MSYNPPLVLLYPGVPSTTTIYSAHGLTGFPSTFDHFLLSMWVCLGPDTNQRIIAFNNTTPWGTISIDSSKVVVLLRPGVSQPIMYNANYNITPSVYRYNLLVSVDAPNEIVQVYLNDELLNPTSGGWIAPGATFDLSGGFNQWSMQGAGSAAPGAAFGDVYAAAPNDFFDLDQEINRRQFINADLTPVNLKPHAIGPLGAQPPIFLSAETGTPSDIATNYGTGGAFTIIGDGPGLIFQQANACSIPSPPLECAVIDTGLIWPITGGVSQLALLGYDNPTRAYSVSGDGSVLAGTANGSDSISHPARWDGTTAALTGLAPDEGVDSSTAGLVMSQDGSIIYSNTNTSIVRWSPSGVDLFPPLAGFDGCAVINFTGRQCSDDGSILFGTSTLSGSNTTITQWTDGIPSSFPLPIEAASSSPTVCSQDGSVVVGQAESEASFWTGGEYFRLNPYIGPSSYTITAMACNSDASIIYGNTAFHVPVYWDNLGHSIIDPTLGTIWGDIHVMDELPGTTHSRDTRIEYSADSGNIAVGWGSNSSSIDTAIRWTGTTAEALETPLDWTGARAHACNGDGSIVVGEVTDPEFRTWACYWDVDGAIHILPGIADPDDTSQGIAMGISRDGTLIFGDGDSTCATLVVIPDGVEITTGIGDLTGHINGLMTMTDLTLSTETLILPDHDITLKWSDDAGASWSNGIVKSVGAHGEYLTAPTWYRLGMARSRIFEISWAGNQAEAMTGAFVGYKLAAS